MADRKRIAALHKQGGVYKPMSEVTPGTQDVLDTPTPAWLDRNYPYVAPPDESCTIKELDYLTSLIPLRAKWRAFVKAADEDMAGLFVVLCSELGVPCDRQALDAVAGGAAVLITKMKWLYNRPRPYQIAAKHNRLAGQGRVTKPGDFWPMNTKTAHTPAYPSGHTIQAYLLASRLSEAAPQHRKVFMKLAHMISFSRAVGGYHWPSDLAFGEDMFRHIVMPHMPSSVRVASRFQKEAKRQLWWHGTSGKNLRSILKQGLIPTGDLVFDVEVDPDRAGGRSIKTFGGIYFSSQWFTAYSSASTANRAVAGVRSGPTPYSKVIIGATIDNRSPGILLDEDQMLGGVERLMGRGFDEVLRKVRLPEDLIDRWGGVVKPGAHGKVSQFLLVDADYGDLPSKYLDHMVSEYPRLEGRVKRQRGALESAIQDVMAAYAAHLLETWYHRFKDDQTKKIRKYIESAASNSRYNDDEKRDKIKVYEEQLALHLADEREIKGSFSLLQKASNRLGEMMREATEMPEGKWRHNIRTMRPVTYRGKDRILMVASITDRKSQVWEDAGHVSSPTDIIFHYGAQHRKPFVDKYEERVGGIARVLDASGKVLEIIDKRGQLDERGWPTDLWGPAPRAYRDVAASRVAGGYRTLYYIGKRPAQPKPKRAEWRQRGQDTPDWVRPWLDAPVQKGVFLTPNPFLVAAKHGVFGHVYAYKVPNWVIKEAGGVHRHDGATEVLIPEPLWKHVRFVGKSMDRADFLDRVYQSDDAAFTDARASMYRVASAYSRSKTACIISVGEWGGKKCLFKNRDRNYTPEVRLYHKVIDGVEVLYMKDELTGWCEGMNEYGIGIVNSALAVHADEKAGKAGKGKSGDPATQNTLRDGKRMLKGLACKSLNDAVEAVKTHMGGLKGHTFIADSEKTVSLEATWRGHDFHQRKLPQSRKHVRTNHGQFHQDAGYTEDSGDDYLSSLARRDQAMKLLRGVDTHDQIAPTIYSSRQEDRSDPLNMVKMTDGMRTNTQVVMNLSDGEMLLYLLPGQVEFIGYQNDLPKNRKPKLTLKVMQYTDLDGDGQYEVEEIEHAP